MENASISDTKVDIADEEIFVLLGQKDCEIYLKDKLIQRLQTQFEKIKSVIIELEEVKKSNKLLSDNNVNFDRVLTEERQKIRSIQEENTKLIADNATLKLKIEENKANVKHSKGEKRSQTRSSNA